MKRTEGSRTALRGFTILELLVSICVLAILVLIMAQIVGMVSDTWRAGKTRVDNFAQARLALGMLDRDVRSGVFLPGLGAFVNADGTGGACALYTRMPGSEGDRKLSLVEYAMSGTTTPGLVRSDYGLDYSTSSRTLSFGSGDKLPDLGKAEAQEIARGVFAFAWQFIDGGGQVTDSFSSDPDHPANTATTKALVVSLAVLDEDALRLADETGTLALLTARTAGTPLSGGIFADFWSDRVLDAGFLETLPQPVRRGVRFFKRVIPIPVERS